MKEQRKGKKEAGKEGREERRNGGREGKEGREERSNEGKMEELVPKGNMWSSVPLPCCLFEIIVNCCRLFYVSRAAAPKGAMSVLFSFCLTRGTKPWL